MRSLIVGLVAAAALTGLPAAASAQSSAQSSTQLPTCSGKRVMREAVHTREFLKAAYIHVFYDSRTSTACAYLNSTNATWGTRKHMTIMLKHCARPSSAFGRCDGQLQSTARRGWYTGRTDTARLKISRGCVMATGRIYWGKHYGLFHTRSTVCASGAGGAGRG
ncbi:hypothetical protein [Nonomuraea ferruginea]|uniref:Subtilisin inhibitor-like n=1 Tax=Nonomuraea ferruginea TaxID=46174 RepID=A0ABT4SS63_9ACTN|nr:hypothetical protein [Nonomuraea ferruginea]MDA0639880.1 hypothetical protein [Nonomuraea ferruginea]